VAEVASGGQVDASTGTTYVTAGGGGQASYPTFLSPVSTVTDERGLRIPELATWSAARSIETSLAVVDVDPGAPGGTTSLTVTALAAGGGVLDRVVLVRARAAAPASVPPAAPDAPQPGAAGPAGRRRPPATGSTTSVGLAAAAGAAGLALRGAARP
jgi:hypothetical protein